MFRHVPNLLTGLRLVLAIVFFSMLAYYQYEGRGDPWFLNTAFVVYLVALVTDFLDGYLARKWKMISTFGRIADPFVDKVFICGSFIFLIPISPLVQPWFVVVIIMREFLVSGLRSFLEARGVEFGAGFGGKLKMFAQSVTIPFVLFYRAHYQDSRAMKVLVIVLLSATLLFTISSTVEYVRRAVGILRRVGKGEGRPTPPAPAAR